MYFLQTPSSMSIGLNTPSFCIIKELGISLTFLVQLQVSFGAEAKGESVKSYLKKKIRSSNTLSALHS